MQNNYYIEPVKKNAEQQPQPEKKSAAFDSQLAIIILQTSICTVIVLTFLVIKFLLPSVWCNLKIWYTENVGAETDIEQVLKNDGTSSTEGIINSSSGVSSLPESSDSRKSSESSAEAQSSDTGNENESASFVSQSNGGSGGPLEISTVLLNYNNEIMSGFSLPMTGTVTSRFGYRKDPFTGKPAMHSGYDIAANTGTNVLASTGGIVEKSVTGSSDYGNYIIISYKTVKTLYGHLSKILVSNGQTVLRKQVIGLCGSTGRSTGPHLHFEIIVNGKRIDPEPFLKTAK